ncbi:integral membrane protein [Alternaria alternata]|nr:integral membrane protein [Alternaria alternata]
MSKYAWRRSSRTAKPILSVRLNYAKQLIGVIGLRNPKLFNLPPHVMDNPVGRDQPKRVHGQPIFRRGAVSHWLVSAHRVVRCVGTEVIACVLTVGIQRNPIRPTSNTYFLFQCSILKMHHEARPRRKDKRTSHKPTGYMSPAHSARLGVSTTRRRQNTSVWTQAPVP